MYKFTIIHEYNMLLVLKKKKQKKEGTLDSKYYVMIDKKYFHKLSMQIL
jgi:hypothetical protein